MIATIGPHGDGRRPDRKVVDVTRVVMDAHSAVPITAGGELRVAVALGEVLEEGAARVDARRRLRESRSAHLIEDACSNPARRHLMPAARPLAVGLVDQRQSASSAETALACAGMGAVVPLGYLRRSSARACTRSISCRRSGWPHPGRQPDSAPCSADARHSVITAWPSARRPTRKRTGGT